MNEFSFYFEADASKDFQELVRATRRFVKRLRINLARAGFQPRITYGIKLVKL